MMTKSNREQRWSDRKESMPKFEIEFRARTAAIMLDNLLGQTIPESIFVDTIRKHDRWLANAKLVNYSAPRCMLTVCTCTLGNSVLDCEYADL